MRQHRGFSLLALAALILVPGIAPALAQSVPLDRYLNHQELTRALQGLANQHRSLASLEALARSDAGREIWLLTLGNPAGAPRDQRPALLLVANLEGNHLIGSSAALHTIEHLLTRYGQDDEVTRLLDEQTIYVVPRVNPDGAELYWSMPGYELPYKPHPSAPDRGGMNIREAGRDLNGDGLITLMRVRDPEGELMPDPNEPRLMRRADRSRAERGMFKVYVEGIDPHDVEAYVPHGSDGVNLNRNFPHEYLYFQPHVGPHQVSEVESRALADLLFTRTNIAAVLTFSPYDNLRSPPPTQRSAPSGTAPGPPTVPANVLPQDRSFHQYISERFNDMTGLRGDGATDEAGSFPQYAYFQAGLPSFTTPVWSIPQDQAAPAVGPGGPGQGGGDLEGEWTISLEVMGEPMDGSLSITRVDGELRASLNTPGGAVELTGQGQGGQFQASGEVPQMGAISVTGRVTGDAMTGSVGLGPMGSASFTGTRVSGPTLASASPAPRAARTGDTPEHRWLRHFDAAGINGFVEWTEAQHPTLGTVEVGGFRPNARVNPPPAEIADLSERHARFTVWLGQQLPKVEIVETKVEGRGDNIFLITATLANERYLPTHFQMGARVRTLPPVTVRILPPEGVTVLTGNPQQQIPRLEGMGARATFTWLVTGRPGTTVPMEVSAQQAGGLLSTTLTLR
jgi:hypothetical protein